MLRNSPREDAAYHEAGHALVTVEYSTRGSDWKVTVPNEPSNGTAGAVHHADLPFDGIDPPVPRGRLPIALSEELAESLRWSDARSAIGSYAGVAAQFASGREWSHLHDCFSGSDREWTVSTFEGIGFSPPDPWRDVFIAAIEVVDRNWSLVEAIAEQLLERRVLTGRDVAAIVKATPRSRSPHRPQAEIWTSMEPDAFVYEQLGNFPTDDGGPLGTES